MAQIFFPRYMQFLWVVKLGSMCGGEMSIHWFLFLPYSVCTMYVLGIVWGVEVLVKTALLPVLMDEHI